MYTKKIPEDQNCGIRVALSIFGGKWKLCILDAINRGIVRPADIQRDVHYAPLRVIEVQLAELLADGVVDKQSGEGFPKKSHYSLTSFGESILPILEQIDQWGTDILRSRTTTR